MLKIINIIVLYIIIFALLIVSNNAKNANTKSNLRNLVLCSTLITLFFWWRDIGLDLEPYKVMYENFEGGNLDSILNLLSSRIEPVHMFAIESLRSWGLSFSAYMLFTSFIPISIISFVISRVETSPILSLYFFLMMSVYPAMDAIRGFFSASFYLLAMYYLSKSNGFRYYILSFASFLSHYSGLIALAARYTLKRKCTINRYMAYLAIAIFSSIFFRNIISGITQDLFENSDVSILFKINYYLNNQDEYEFINNIHRILLGLRVYSYLMFYLLLNAYILSRFNVKRNLTNFEQTILGSQIFGSILSVFLLGLGADDFAFRVCFFLCIGSFFLVKKVVVGTGSAVHAINIRFSTITLILMIIHFINILYLAGVHQPNSPFYLG